MATSWVRDALDGGTARTGAEASRARRALNDHAK